MVKDIIGVYSIKDKEGREYIGSSVHINRRWAEHLSALKRHTHGNYLLQKSFNIYKKNFFDFKVLLICETKDLLFYEQLIIDNFKPFYNIITVVSNPGIGRKASSETRAKMSKTRKGRKLSQETKDKISKSHMGKSLSQEHKNSISMTLTGRKGRPLSDEGRRKVSEANKGRKRPDLAERNRNRVKVYGESYGFGGTYG